MRQELRRFRSAILLILAFTLGLGAQLLQAQVSVTPGRYRFGATIAPTVNDGAALGTISLGWSDLHIATGGVINWANGEVTITETDANTLTLAGGQFALPAGSVSAPSLVSTQDLTIGFMFVGGSPVIAEAGNRVFELSTSPFLSSAGLIRWATTADLYAGSPDLYIGRDGTARLQVGQDAAVPIAQTIKGPDAREGTDVDTAGGDIRFAAGRGTGTGNPGNIYFQTGATNTPGTGAGPLTTRLQIASSGVTIIASHTRFNVASSTTGTNTPVFSGNAPIGQTAPYVWVAAIASDGTAVWIPAWR